MSEGGLQARWADGRPLAGRDGVLRELLSQIAVGSSPIYVTGVGGVGKSALRRSLAAELAQDARFASASVDLQLPEFRNRARALFFLRSQFGRNGYRFKRFDYAHKYYWRAVNSPAVAADGAGRLVEVGSLGGAAAGFLHPVAGLVGLLVKPVAWVLAVFRAKILLREFPALMAISSLDPQQIEELLPRLWMDDLILAQARNGRTGVVLVDSVEALTGAEGVRGEGLDESRFWLTDLLTVAEGPEFVLFGRDRRDLGDDEPTSQTGFAELLLEGLSEAVSESWLGSCGVREAEIRQAIVKASRGEGGGLCHPDALNIGLDTYQAIRESGRKAEARHFSDLRRQAAPRLLRHLGSAEADTLKCLSVPRYWDDEVLALLIDHFSLGLSKFATRRLARFSFVAVNPGSRLMIMHPFMRSALQAVLDSQTQLEIHQLLFRRYGDLLAARARSGLQENSLRDFSEAAYHASRCMEPYDLADWFFGAAKAFARGQKWEFLTMEYRELVDSLAASLSLDHPLVCRALTNLAETYKRRGLWVTARAVLLKVLSAQASALGKAHPDYATTLSNLAGVCLDLGDYGEADAFAQEALVLQVASVGRRDSATLETLTNLGLAAMNLGRFDDADRVLREVALTREAELGAENPQTLSAWGNLAALALFRDDSAEARRLYDRVLDTRINALGPTHPSVADSQRNLAGIDIEEGRYEAATKRLEQASSIYAQVHGEHHPQVGIVLVDLAVIDSRRGRDASARLRLEEALTILSLTLPNEHPAVLTARLNLAVVCRALGDTATEEQLLDELRPYEDRLLGSQWLMRQYDNAEPE